MRLLIRCLSLGALVAVPHLAFAQDVRRMEVIEESIEETEEEVVEGLTETPAPTTRLHRAGSYVTPIWSPYSLGTWIPFKKGFSLAWILNEEFTFEPEYSKGSFGFKFQSIDFAEFSETLYLFPVRWYPDTNSFNFFAGPGVRRYRLSLGQDLLRTFSSDVPGSVDLLKVETYVLDLGVGNRWQFAPGFTVGCDWFSLLIPLGPGTSSAPVLDYVENAEVKKNLGRVVSLLRYSPTFSLLKVQVGWTF